MASSECRETASTLEKRSRRCAAAPPATAGGSVGHHTLCSRGRCPASNLAVACGCAATRAASALFTPTSIARMVHVISASPMNSATSTEPVNTPAIAIIPVSSIALSSDPLKSRPKIASATAAASAIAASAHCSPLSAIAEFPLFSTEFTAGAVTSPSVALSLGAAPKIDSVSESLAARIST